MKDISGMKRAMRWANVDLGHTMEMTQCLSHRLRTTVRLHAVFYLYIPLTTKLLFKLDDLIESLNTIWELPNMTRTKYSNA